MEGLTRLVAESLARHGFDRPLDYRRLRWSRWFRCESPHSLLFVPSKPGVFAVAEEIMDLDSSTDRVGTAAPGRQAERSSAAARHVGDFNRVPQDSYPGTAEAMPFDGQNRSAALAAEGRRMLAVTQFFEADDMAFVLDRMLSRPNPLQARLASGRYFVRFVVIEDSPQRRSICSALNQWMVSAAEKASGIGSHFASSLELAPEGNGVPAFTPLLQENGVPHFSPPLREVGLSTALSESSHPSPPNASSEKSIAAPSAAGSLACDSAAATNIHNPAPFPSGF